MKNILSLKFIESKEFFYSILFVNLLFLCFTSFYPSMDGASHLYNSNLLGQILKGNIEISQFYSISSLPIPNWMSHFVLGIFTFILPGWMAEKIFLILYVAGMALSFRYLIKQINSDAPFLSILIFPFIYSFLFHLGFYNFSISFIFLFLALGYFVKNMTCFSVKKYVLLFLLLTLTYFSNILIFGFLGLILGLFIVHSSYVQYKTTNDPVWALKQGSKKLLLLLLISLPGLISMFVFLDNVTFFPTEQALASKELIKWIIDARPFIIYDYVADEINTQHYFYIILILILIPFVKKGVKLSEITFAKADIFLLATLISLILYFVTPNGASAGMMSDRYCLTTYIFGITWVCSRATKNNLNRVLVLLMVFFHLNLLYRHFPIIKSLDKHAVSVYQSSKHLNENSIVLPVNLSDNWLEPHFSNYLGADKPLLILENYEASVGWFPVKWNDDNFPKIQLGNRNSIRGITWRNNLKSTTVRQIDNILLYGNVNKINNPKWHELSSILSSEFRLVHTSDDNFVMLYEKLIFTNFAGKTE